VIQSILAVPGENTMNAGLLKRSSAFLPVVMSATALSIVLSYAVMFGVARQADEGTAAHVWQLLMAGQFPIIAFFVFKWFPSQPKQASLVLALQIGAALAAKFPVWWFGW
jgi:hypothetical protein